MGDVSGRDPYIVIDPVLMPWAQRHGIKVGKIDRDWHVRSIWVYDKNGNRKAQMWLEFPDSQGNVTIKASALDLESPTKWGAKEERRASLRTLDAALEELRPILFDWAGPGAFTA
jgi:hypothetical protein